MITLAQLDQALRRKEMASVYLLQGAEWHLQRTAIEHITRTLHRLRGEAAEPIRFAGDATSAAGIVEQAETFGLFSAYQLMIVTNVDAWRADDLEIMARYATAPNPATTLILAAEKLDGRTKAAKTLTQHAVVVTCKPLYANQIPDWIRMECERRGKPIAREAAQLLAEAVGTDLASIAEAIEKILLYAGDVRLIESKVIEHVILATSSQDIFAFTRAVGEGDIPSATKRLDALLAANEPAMRILTLLARHWRLLYQTRWCREHGRTDEKSLAAALKVHPFFVREYAEQAAALPLPRLQRGFRCLAQADRLLKRSARPDHDIMTDCLVRLCMVTS